MMPGVARVIDALPARGRKSAEAGAVLWVPAHHDKPRPVLQRKENLASQGVPLHQRDRDGPGARPGDHNADVDSLGIDRG